MKIFRLNLRNVATIIACLAVSTSFWGCKEKKDDPAITVANEQLLKQEVFADNLSGKTLTSFTTTGPWTSSIAETTPKAKSGKPDWISIDPASGDKAGTYNVSIILEPNTTGSDRTAVITILCKGEEIKITITQKGIKENEGNNDLVGTWEFVEKYYLVKSKGTIIEQGTETANDIGTYLIVFKADGTFVEGTETRRWELNNNTLRFFCDNACNEGNCSEIDCGGPEIFTIVTVTSSTLVYEKRTAESENTYESYTKYTFRKK